MTNIGTKSTFIFENYMILYICKYFALLSLNMFIYVEYLRLHSFRIKYLQKCQKKMQKMDTKNNNQIRLKLTSKAKSHKQINPKQKYIRKSEQFNIDSDQFRTN